jgi:hypothetical protein
MGLLRVWDGRAYKGAHPKTQVFAALQRRIRAVGIVAAQRPGDRGDVHVEVAQCISTCTTPGMARSALAICGVVG